MRQNIKMIVIALAVSCVVAVTPATAQQLERVVFAKNSDKVDGKHAVGAASSASSRRGKLVATDPKTGRLPNDIIRKARDADRLDGLDSTDLLRDSQIRLSQQRGWLVQNGNAGAVQTYSNVQQLAGTSLYYLPLVTPNAIGNQEYYLSAVEVCYNAAASGKIDGTSVTRSSFENYVDETFDDGGTDRTSVFPTTECYTVPIDDTAAPAVSVYNLRLDVVNDVRIVRVTTTFTGK